MKKKDVTIGAVLVCGIGASQPKYGRNGQMVEVLREVTPDTPATVEGEWPYREEGKTVRDGWIVALVGGRSYGGHKHLSRLFGKHPNDNRRWLAPAGILTAQTKATADEWEAAENARREAQSERWEKSRQDAEVAEALASAAKDALSTAGIAVEEISGRAAWNGPVVKITLTPDELKALLAKL